jgi:hypothetical protein
MAAREGQGMKIATIIFAFLTIVLAVTTFMFYAQAQTALKEKTDAQNARQQIDQENKKLLFRVQAMNYALGLKGVTEQEVEIAKGAAGQDADAEEVLAGFKADMAALGYQVAPDGAPKNYRTMGNILLAALNRKNESLSNANAQTGKARQDLDTTVKAEKQRADEAVAARDKAANDLNTERATYISTRQEMEERASKLQATLDDSIKKAKSEFEDVSGSLKKTQEKSENLRRTVEIQKKHIKSIETQQSLFENPDGRITRVNQGLRQVWIDVGRDDGLLRQTTFAVYDHNESGLANSKPKGSIEVISLGDRISEAKIIEDSAANPIISGDVIHTPAWSPGQRIHFALAGKMDINGDSVDDYEMVRNIIRINGGEIDAELRPDGTRTGKITVNTRYLVRGNVEASKELIDKFKDMSEEVTQFGTDTKSVKDILALMGWKADERMVNLGGGTSAAFRKRQPGKTEPAATTPATDSTAPATPATDAKAAPATADPFGAAPAADPFGTSPTPKAAPVENDPFK